MKYCEAHRRKYLKVCPDCAKFYRVPEPHVIRHANAGLHLASDGKVYRITYEDDSVQRESLAALLPALSLRRRLS